MKNKTILYIIPFILIIGIVFLIFNHNNSNTVINKTNLDYYTINNIEEFTNEKNISNQVFLNTDTNELLKAGFIKNNGMFHKTYFEDKILYEIDLTKNIESLYYVEDKQKHLIDQYIIPDTTMFRKTGYPMNIFYQLNHFFGENNRVLFFNLTSLIGERHVEFYYDTVLKKTVKKYFRPYNVYYYKDMAINCIDEEIFDADGTSRVTLNIIPELEKDIFVFPFNYNSYTNQEYQKKNKYMYKKPNKYNHSLFDCKLDGSYLEYVIIYKSDDEKKSQYVKYYLNLDELSYTKNYFLMENILFNRNTGLIELDLNKHKNIPKDITDSSILKLISENKNELIFQITNNSSMYSLDLLTKVFKNI